MPTFDPPTYSCYRHPIDLTDKVTVEALMSDDVYGLTQAPHSGPTPFTVPVTCPGTGPDDGPHEVIATGTWSW